MTTNTTKPADLLAPFRVLVTNWRAEAAAGRIAADRQGIRTETSITMHSIVNSMLQLSDELQAAIDSLAAHRGEAVGYVPQQAIDALNAGIPLYIHPPQAHRVEVEPVAWRHAWTYPHGGYISSLSSLPPDKFLATLVPKPNALHKSVPLYEHPPQAQAGAGDIEAMVDCMARVVAESAGEDFDTIGEFAQSILLDTQRAALLAALEISHEPE